jgi:hypothetical protein
MRKWILTAIFSFVILIGCIYVFIPPDIEISKIDNLNCSLAGAYRNISNENKWAAWWPDFNTNLLPPGSDSPFKYRNIHYSIVEKLRNEIVVQMDNEQFKLHSNIRLISKGNDSVIIQWHCSLPSGRNPLNKIKRYFEAVNIKDNMKYIFQNLRTFLENPENVYGISISETSTWDTCLLATKYSYSNYPTTDEIYSAVSSLKTFAFEHGLFINGNPMLNVNKLNDHTFQTMIAVPVDRDLSATGTIYSKRMVPGRFMVADVKGGIHTVNNAIEQLQLYFEDYHKTSMAIPFQSLVTDRNTEPDTLKWMTRIYAPVLQ